MRWCQITATLLIALGGICIHSKPGRAEDRPALKIAATLALTGKLAFVGESERRGLELAVDEVNASGGAGGRTLKLIVDDNQGDPRSAVSGVMRLLATENPDIIFSAFTHITQAIAPIAAKSPALMIYASSVRTMTGEGPHIFRDYYDIEDTAERVLKTIVAARKKRIVLLSELVDACNKYDSAITENSASAGIEIAARQTYQAEETDLRPLLLKIRELKPDAISMCSLRTFHMVVRQLNEMHMTDIQLYQLAAPFLPVADTPEMRTLYEKIGLVSSWYGFVESGATPAQRDFVNKFRTRYGSEPRPDAAFAYDDVKLIAQGADACRRPEKTAQEKFVACLNDFLHSVNFSGAAGSLSFDAQGVSRRPTLMMAVKEGRWVELE